MTNEELITGLGHIAHTMERNGHSYYQHVAENAIKALEQQPGEDCISREAVNVLVDELARAISDERIGISRGRSTATIMRDILHLSSVTPQQKIGRWRHYEGMLICSECGAEFYDDIMEYCGDDVPKCCPNCGIKNGG